MCGISGFNWENQKLINQMKTKIVHRGPDDNGTFIGNNISLGHVRLSILDLSERGHQPMGIQILGDKKYKLIYRDSELDYADIIIVYNGEIYNYTELKSEMCYSFESNSDTEVILKSYLKWSFECVSKFIGMWAFCIYDRRKSIFFCSRDRLGQKPFYYYFFDGKFVFCSELKGILECQDLNIINITNVFKKAMELYFSLGYIPSPYTIYKNIYKLSASHNLIFDLQNKKIIKIWQYWELPKLNLKRSKKILIKQGKKLLISAIKLRLRSDVPLGILLSGGLDSTSVLGCIDSLINLKDVNAFSIGFSGKTDETYYISLVSDYFKPLYHHRYFKKKDFNNLLRIYPKIYDEPFGDYAGFPTIFLSELASKYVTVVLGGDGGDEIFGGYQIHQGGSVLDLLYKFPIKLRWIIFLMISALSKILSLESVYKLGKLVKASLKRKVDFFINYYEEGYTPDSFKIWTRQKLRYSLSKGGFKMGDAFRIYDLLFNTLPDTYLVKIDRASMHYSLEVRSPYLDHRFFEFAQSIPAKWKQTPFNTKILMRKIIRDFIPKEIYKRKGKYGFTPPLSKWLMDNSYIAQLDKIIAILEKILPDFVKFYIKKVKNKEDKLSMLYKIRLFIFSLWWNEWFKGNINY